MSFLVTGSAGHLGEALVRTLREKAIEVRGLDVLESPFTTIKGSITDRSVVRRAMEGVEVVFHAATLVPPAGEPTAWITEEVVPIPKNIYGVTKAAAENLCQLYYRNQGLPCIVLRTSRFFPEDDDDEQMRAAERARTIGYGIYIVSATIPFAPGDLPALRSDAPSVVRRRVPAYAVEYARRGWTMTQGVNRVYVNDKARRELGWAPVHDFTHLIDRLSAQKDLWSPLARLVGSKGYHRAVC